MQQKTLIFKNLDRKRDKILLDGTDSINKAILNRTQANFKTYFRMHFAWKVPNLKNIQLNQPFRHHKKYKN